MLFKLILAPLRLTEAIIRTPLELPLKVLERTTSLAEALIDRELEDGFRRAHVRISSIPPAGAIPRSTMPKRSIHQDEPSRGSGGTRPVPPPIPPMP